MVKIGTFSVKIASDEKFCPSTVNTILVEFHNQRGEGKLLLVIKNK